MTFIHFIRIKISLHFLYTYLPTAGENWMSEEGYLEI